MGLAKIIRDEDSISSIKKMYAQFRLNIKYFERGLRLLNEHFRDMIEYVEKEN